MLPNRMFLGTVVQVSDVVHGPFVKLCSFATKRRAPNTAEYNDYILCSNLKFWFFFNLSYKATQREY